MSIIVLPTGKINSSGVPSASRLDRASGEWVNSRSATASVRSRLVSSGIVRSKLRRPCLHVADPLIELARDERCGQRRVDIAGDEHDVRRQLDEHRLEALHHARGLNGVSARTNVERVIRSADSELLEEDPGHRVVVVLAGMHEHVLELRPRVEPCSDRRDLHVIRARADDGDDPPGAKHRRDCIHQADYSRSPRGVRGKTRLRGSGPVAEHKPAESELAAIAVDVLDESPIQPPADARRVLGLGVGEQPALGASAVRRLELIPLELV